MSLTSVQITRAASDALDLAVKASGLKKGYLADIAIKHFLDPSMNPNINEALQNLADGRQRAEQEFVERVFAKGTES